jgi:alkyl hydroperoxide reductase subunit AhpC
VDTLESHKEWVKQIEQLEGSKLTFPIIDDSDKKISTAYGMLHPADMSKSTVRSLFIVNPAKFVPSVKPCKLSRIDPLNPTGTENSG